MDQQPKLERSRTGDLRQKRQTENRHGLATSKALSGLLNWALLVLVLGFTSSCRKSSDAKRELNPAERIWTKVEYEYRTNELHTAYRLILAANDELERMAVSRPEELNYDYCLARVNGRLFLIARSLGDTNAAERFLKRSALHFNAHRRKQGIATTNYSATAIELLMKEWDANVHPAGTNARASYGYEATR